MEIRGPWLNMNNFEEHLIDALTEGSRGLKRLRRKGDAVDAAFGIKS